MKLVTKLELPRDFDKKLTEKINNVANEAIAVKGRHPNIKATSSPDYELKLQIVLTEVKRLVKQAYKLGTQAPVHSKTKNEEQL